MLQFYVQGNTFHKDKSQMIHHQIPYLYGPGFVQLHYKLIVNSIHELPIIIRSGNRTQWKQLSTHVTCEDAITLQPYA